jgi:hypothetical protein
VETVTNVSSAGNNTKKAMELADVRLESVYPPSLLAKLPQEEASCIMCGWNSLYTSKIFDPLPNVLVAEGTSPCASRLYTHDSAERYERATASDASNEILKSFAPSVMRGFRWLDSSKTGEHKFYRAFAELILHPDIGLYTEPKLRASGDATPHLVLTQPSVNGVVTKAGATPKQLATGAFGAIPLFTMGEEEGALFDEAMEENERNTIRPPKGVYEVDDLQAVNLDRSLGALKKLHDKLPREPTREDVTEATWLASFAALANNPHGVGVFLDELSSVEGVSGEIDLHPIRGLARHKDSEKELGAFVALSLMVPPR